MRPTRIAKALGARWLRLTGRLPEHSKQWRAAGFFLENFKEMSTAELDALIATTWRDRKLEEMMRATGLDLSDPSLNVLDIGGGLTTVARICETPNKWVLDVCVDELRKGGATFKPGVRYVNGSAHEVPFPDDFFDYVFCSNALDHFEDPALALREMKRIVKPDGFVIIVIDVFEPEYRRKPGTLHPHCFTRPEAEQLLAAEFDVTWSHCPAEVGKLGFSSRAKGLTTPKPGRREMSFVLHKRA
jgi:ubiquinone/menaquinone biosynthesis C-methylase UbiE